MKEKEKLTRNDKLLRSVLLDPVLMRKGGYEEKDCLYIEDALRSDNPVVKTVALILDRDYTGSSENDIYRELIDYLKKAL